MAKTALEQHIELYALHKRDPDQFYSLARKNLASILPLIYTPTIGEAIETYSDRHAKPQTMIIPYEARDRLNTFFNGYEADDIDLVIVTDGEGILGIGDQGANGHLICLGKGMVYSLIANIDHRRILPICLDVGTNNETLLNHPNYFGSKHPRITGDAYFDFVQQVVLTIKQKFPRAVLHWEDFGKQNAQMNLEQFRHIIPSFNDDIQGTGVVTLGCLLTALRRLERNLSDQRVVIFGAGSAGIGIANQITNAMMLEGLSQEEAYSRIYLLGRQGLLRTSMEKLLRSQQPYAKDAPDSLDLKATIQRFRPQILIGCSTAAGAFDEEVVRLMCEQNEHPIIFPLSNPTKKSEAHPADIIKWSNGRALIATGSPFEPVIYMDKTYIISQCNNAYVFPAIGLIAIQKQLTEITDELLTKIAIALAEYQQSNLPIEAPLLPPLIELAKVTEELRQL